MKNVDIIDWGLIPYAEAVAKQEELRQELIDQKRQLKSGVLDRKTVSHKLILCQHPHVYTIGKSGKIDHLKYSETELSENRIEFYQSSRGGDITYHGPGQLVVYPILDLDEIFNDVHRYVRSLEKVVIELLSEYNIEGTRIKEYTGVWVHDEETQSDRKICAIGVHLSRWVSMHGLALNVNPDLGYFSGIVPCGINEETKSLTSIQKEVGSTASMESVVDLLVPIFLRVFGLAKSQVETKIS